MRRDLSHYSEEGTTDRRGLDCARTWSSSPMILPNILHTVITRARWPLVRGSLLERRRLWLVGTEPPLFHNSLPLGISRDPQTWPQHSIPALSQRHILGVIKTVHSRIQRRLVTPIGLRTPRHITVQQDLLICLRTLGRYFLTAFSISSS